MNVKNSLIFLSMVLFSSSQLVQGAIKVICTTALVDSPYAAFREQQYRDAFTMLQNLGVTDFYVVEAIKKGGTFLEQFSAHVFYATVNNPYLRNQGVNEAKTLLEACEHFGFEAEDMIIKLTGRHKVTSDFLINLVAEHPEVDAFVKVNPDGSAVTVGFAMKYKYLKEMYENIDYDYINRHMISIEFRVNEYIEKKKKEGNFNVYYLDKLDIIADIFGSTTAPGLPHQITIF